MQAILKISLQLCFLVSLFFITFQESGAVPRSGLSKPKALDLAHSCIKVASDENRSNDDDDYDDDDDDDDTTILLLHWLTGSIAEWKGIPQLLALKTGKRVCAADLRNHGESPWSDDDIDVAAMAEDVSLLVDTINSPKTIVIGHSLGGKLAVHFTLNHPHKVKKMIVADMRPNGMTPLATAIVSGAMPMFVDALTAIPDGADEKTARDTVADYLNSRIQLVNFTGFDPKILPMRFHNGKFIWKTNPVVFEQYHKHFLSLMNESSGLYLGPTLFVYGTVSPFKVNEDADMIREFFPNAEIVPEEGSNHDVHRHREFLDIVIKFINE